MRTPLKLAAYGAVLAITFFAALGAGTLLGDPAAVTGSEQSPSNEMDPSDMAEH